MNYALIKHCDMVDGPGLRVTLFVSGCSNHCDECHNPETHDPNFGELFTEDSFNEIVDELKEDWCSGLTLCGGDPLFHLNRKSVLDISKKVKSLFKDKTIFMYTGYTLQEILSWNDPDVNSLLNYIDYLADGRYIKSLRSVDKKWVGSSNQNVYKITHFNNNNKFEIIGD